MSRVWLFLALAATLGCRSLLNSQSDARERWFRERSYYALVELVDTQLELQPRDATFVRQLLGDPSDDWRTSELCWLYASSRAVPWGSYLLIHFDEDGNVTSLEWASE